VTDYEWYLQSCANNGVKPLSERRFAVFLDAYQTRFRTMSTEHFASQSHGAQMWHLRRWYRILQIAEMADAGRNVITAGGVQDRQFTPPTAANRPDYLQLPSQDEPPPPTDGAPGVREPRRPVAPVLAGSAARTYPPTIQPRWAAI
jgi:hypothetical protein